MEERLTRIRRPRWRWRPPANTAFVAIARRSPAPRAVTIEKTRNAFAIDGIIAEYAQVRFGGAMVGSTCVERDNYNDMKHLIEGSGVAAFPNTRHLPDALRGVDLN